eukprot:12718756-Ditylum_brightwellii.AAC.1
MTALAEGYAAPYFVSRQSSKQQSFVAKRKKSCQISFSNVHKSSFQTQRRSSALNSLDNNNETPSSSVLIGTAGLLAQPIVWTSLYFVVTKGGGLPAGPFGLLGLIEGLSYLIIVGFVATSLTTKLTSGTGLQDAEGEDDVLLGAAE